MLCKSCGQVVEADKRFCTNCGAPCSAPKGDPFAGVPFYERMGLESLGHSAESNELLSYSFGLDLPRSSATAESPAQAVSGGDSIKSNLDFAGLENALVLPDLTGIVSDTFEFLNQTSPLLDQPQSQALASLEVGEQKVTDVGQTSAEPGKKANSSGGVALPSALVAGFMAEKHAKKTSRRITEAQRIQRLMGLKNENLRPLLEKALSLGGSLPLGEWRPILEGSLSELSEQYQDADGLASTIPQLLKAGKQADPQLLDELKGQQREIQAIAGDISALRQAAQACRNRYKLISEDSGKSKVEVANLLELKDSLMQVTSQAVEILERIQKVRAWWESRRTALNQLAAKILLQDLKRFPNQELPDCEPLLLLALGSDAPHKDLPALLLDTAQISTYMGWSIVNLVLCCPPLGVGALFFSLRCYLAKQSGNAALAQTQSKYALECNFCSLIFGIVFWIMMVLNDT